MITSYPACSKRFAIGLPIAPSPMNPIRLCILSHSCLIFSIQSIAAYDILIKTKYLKKTFRNSERLSANKKECCLQRWYGRGKAEPCPYHTTAEGSTRHYKETNYGPATFTNLQDYC